MSKIFLQKNRGFTIMETLIAISLLLLAVTGPMVFAQNALRAAFNSRDQVTAFYLAQDAIELVKNVRDNNFLSGKTGYADSNKWLDGLDVCGTESGGCTVDTSDALGDFKICSNGTEPGCLGSESDASQDVHLKVENSIIGLSGDEESIFSRVVYIDNDTPDEAKITVRVRWKSHENVGAREITVVEYMYNWANTIIN